MAPSFNLVESPWIPCVFHDGKFAELGLGDMLRRASDIREIADASPPVVVALHRLLVAIVHRAVDGPADATAWADLWRPRTFSPNLFEDYFQRDGVRGRFDLFDTTNPFYQVASLDFELYARPAALLAHELRADVGNALFNHGLTESAGISAARAARLLVAHQSFAVGGLVSLQKGENPLQFKSADAAPLTKGAVVLARGDSLFDTLLLNLHAYNKKDDRPFATNGDDRPAWERMDPTTAGDRAPAGYLDYLTWQSRRIRLCPEAADNGEYLVRRVVIMKGHQFPDGFQRRNCETMVAFRAVKDAKPGQDPWPAISFGEGRALWRDSMPLLETSAATHERPRIVSWLGELAGQGHVPRRQSLLEIAGLSVDRAKVFFWRHERLPLPLAYLADKDLLDALKEALRLAEEVGKALRDATSTLAALLVAPESDFTGGRQPPKEVVQDVVDGLATDRSYWPRLEAPFRALLVALPDDPGDVEAGQTYGGRQLPAWAEELRLAARAAFDVAANALDGSARALKAVARAERRFNGRLKKALEVYPAENRPKEIPA